MSTFIWPTEDGWPYPDTVAEIVDLDAELDDDLMSLRVPTHLFDDLDPIERRIVMERYGLQGEHEHTMGELHDELGLSDAELGTILGTALGKLRAQLIG